MFFRLLQKTRAERRTFLTEWAFSSVDAFFLQEGPELASKPVDMNDDISPLLEFLDRCGPEVQGRGLSGLEAEQVAMIERFIAGRCDENERRELSAFLQLHPAWIRWIADRVKLAREIAEESTERSA